MPSLASVAPGPSAPNGAATASTSSTQPGTDSSGPGVDYYYEHRISPPAVINGFPHDWTPWYPEDEYQMSSWNQYGGDVFHVYTDPTGDWAWGDDVFDLAGWPSNDEYRKPMPTGFRPANMRSAIVLPMMTTPRPLGLSLASNVRPASSGTPSA